MIKYILFPFLVFTGCFFNVLFGQVAPKSILQATARAVSARQSVTYKATYRIKHINETDTNALAGKVMLMRDEKDTIWGGQFWFTANDSFFKFYDLENLYSNEGGKDTVIRYALKADQSWPVYGNISSGLIWESFFDPKRFVDDVAKENKLFLKRDTMIDHLSCWHLKISYPNQEGFTNAVKNLYISKQDTLPMLSVYKVKFQGDYQYSEFKMTDRQFNTLTAENFKPLTLLKNYKVVDYVQPPEEDMKLLDSGSTAPLLVGDFYKSAHGQQDTLKYAGNITILDFWYMSCYPCIKAIPEIEKIALKYKNVKVYGINSNDNNADGKKALPNFIKHNPIKYPIFFVNDKSVASYLVKAWPSFYVIDQKGQVYFTTLGYNENLYAGLSKAIDRLMKK